MTNTYTNKERVVIEHCTSEDGYAYYYVHVEGNYDRIPMNLDCSGIFHDADSIDEYSDEWEIVEDGR